jgi:hypothetical protein
VAKRVISTFPPKLRSGWPMNRGQGQKRIQRKRSAPEVIGPDEARRRQIVEYRWKRIRDRMHVGMMRSGMCMICYGWVDDPRHTELQMSW